ncbi:AbrB/MazE/SpoVT family DNA-binding domain-containing protein [Candidatus Pacearchaeota archaeon]|nr:AbrB/MazE/SpoVT family DNA-binding domain-containing protein [Candidatus Pacearchaeota archaeon]
MEIKTIAKRWGSSIGIILPKSIVDAKKINENDELIIEIKNRNLTEDLFGKYPRKTDKSAQELKDEARKGWD